MLLKNILREIERLMWYHWYGLNEKNAKAYLDKDSISTFKQFPGRGHFICGQPGWDEVAGYVEDWLEIYVVASPVYAR